jgi:putative nucleotidyltransferase with HDIG domain
MKAGLPEKLIDQIMVRGELYEVGGSVRDALISPGSENKDRDFLVTGIPLNELTSILTNHGKVDLVGRSFGVMKFAPRGGDVTHDFAIPRKERSTGLAHRDFDVTYDHTLPVETDLYRRDFTINAMARRIPSGEIIDPYGGREDIKRRLIRVVFPGAIGEDPLRILRGAQFAARLEFEIETATLQAMKDAAGLIDTVSPERIAEEINKMLVRAVRPSIGFRYLLEIGVLECILPELTQCVGVEQPGGFHRWDVFDHTMVCIEAAPQRLHLRLAALFHDVGKPATRELVEGGATFYGHDKLSVRMAIKALKRLRYSNDIIEKVSTLVGKHMFSDRAGEKGIRRLIKNVGQDLIFDLLDLRRADIVAQGMGQKSSEVDDFESSVRTEIEKKPPFGLKDLDINGNDIMVEFGLKQGPLIGRILNDLLEMVLDNPAANTHEALMSRAREFLAQQTESQNHDNEGKDQLW